MNEFLLHFVDGRFACSTSEGANVDSFIMKQEGIDPTEIKYFVVHRIGNNIYLSIKEPIKD